MKRFLPPVGLAFFLLLSACSGAEEPAVAPRPEKASATVEDALAAYDRGLDYLKTRFEGKDFGDPGLTGLATAAFLRRPGGVRPGDRELVKSCLDSLVAHQKPNGGIYDQALMNYVTCAAVMALAEAEGEEYRKTAARAAEFLKTLQKPSGGIGYSDKHPDESDLSNTQFAVESLRKAGVPVSDPVFSKALKFLQSVQNRTESNRTEYSLKDGRIVAVQDDGGAYYKPSESKAGIRKLPDGRIAFRSYGSMTYALLKCYLLAGLPKDDPRVQAAVKWIKDHYTVEENPGFDTRKDPRAGQQGYFYYLYTMAKALDLLGETRIIDADGIARDWRADLRAALLSRQREDGSWKNEHSRWMEADPLIATSYALTALSYCTE